MKSEKEMVGEGKPLSNQTMLARLRKKLQRILCLVFHLSASVGFCLRGGEIVFSCLIAPNSQMNLICIFPHFATSPTFNQMKCEKKKIEDHCIGGGGEGVK